MTKGYKGIKGLTKDCGAISPEFLIVMTQFIPSSTGVSVLLCEVFQEPQPDLHAHFCKSAP